MSGNNGHWRKIELAHFGQQLDWLDKVLVAEMYVRTAKYISKSHYGLNQGLLDDFDRLDVDEDEGADTWLSVKLDSGPVVVLFNRTEGFRTQADLFISSWRDMFCPSRDDVIIIPENGNWLLFYCHEDEFEFGRRRA